MDCANIVKALRTFHHNHLQWITLFQKAKVEKPILIILHSHARDVTIINIIKQQE